MAALTFAQQRALDDFRREFRNHTSVRFAPVAEQMIGTVSGPVSVEVVEDNAALVDIVITTLEWPADFLRSESAFRIAHESLKPLFSQGMVRYPDLRDAIWAMLEQLAEHASGGTATVPTT